MTSRILTVQPLTAEAFTPYGEVLSAGAAKQQFPINEGLTERFHQLAKVDTRGEGAGGIISLFRTTPKPTEQQRLSLTMMERHPLGSQAFMPLSNRPYLVVVAPPGELNEEDIVAFLASPNQGVNYAVGTWHHYCLALEDVSDFLVIDRQGPGNNCDEVTLTTSLTIELEALPSLSSLQD